MRGLAFNSNELFYSNTATIPSQERRGAHQAGVTCFGAIALSYTAMKGHGDLLPIRSEERGVLRVGSIPVAIILSCQGMKTIALELCKHEYSWIVKIRNTSEAVLRPQYTP